MSITEPDAAQRNVTSGFVGGTEEPRDATSAGHSRVRTAENEEIPAIGGSVVVVDAAALDGVGDPGGSAVDPDPEPEPGAVEPPGPVVGAPDCVVGPEADGSEPPGAVVVEAPAADDLESERVAAMAIPPTTSTATTIAPTM